MAAGVKPCAGLAESAGLDVRAGARRGRRADAHVGRRRLRRPATSRSRATPPPGATWRSSTGARRSTWARSRARTIAGAAGAVGRRPRLLVDDRRAHAQVRRVGRRLRRDARRRPRRRRVDGLVRREGVTVGVLTHERDEDYERGRELIESEGAAAVKACVRRPGARRGGADRRVHRRARRARRASAETTTRCCSCSTAAPTPPSSARARAAGGADAARDRGDRAGVGHARRQGMDLAAERLPPDGLIATTDADSEPAPRLAARAARRGRAGARAIGGRIELGAARPPARGAAPARARTPPSAAPRIARPRARASTTSSAAPRSRSRPRPTRRSAGSSRARRWRTRASSARCTATACRSSGSPPCASRRPAGASAAPAAGSRSTCAATAGWPSAATTPTTSRSTGCSRSRTAASA